MVQRLEPGYYEKDFDAVAYELSQLSPDSEELIMESVAEQRTAVLEVPSSTSVGLMSWPNLRSKRISKIAYWPLGLSQIGRSNE